ncbi:hypothetical protein BS78_04G291600 [Paspalum vaginatum]|nr:hypothetical protein BS78_04G291600 [Paspalum vaginatum]
MTSHLTRPRLSPELLHCQQHAMALDSSSSYDCCVFPPLDWDWDCDWDWELHHTLGLGGAGAGAGTGGADLQLQDDREAAFFPATRVESPASSEASSGFLQDAVVDHWSGRCNKRQRMAAATPPRRPATVSEDLQCLLESFWDSSADAEQGGGGDLRHGSNTTTTPEAELRCSFVSGEDGAGASGRGERQRDPSAQVLLPAAAAAAAAQGGAGGGEVAAPVVPATVRAAAATQQEQLLQKTTAHRAGAPHAAARRDDRSRPPVGRCDCDCEPPPASACPSSLAGEEEEEEEEKRGVGVLYPFAVVKPLGLDDGRMTTLNDVNQRILKRPARPVRHPVGPFACGPAVSAHGLGLSGKAVVSLTKIRTGGSGTITIVRTRG